MIRRIVVVLLFVPSICLGQLNDEAWKEEISRHIVFLKTMNDTILPKYESLKQNVNLALGTDDRVLIEDISQQYEEQLGKLMGEVNRNQRYRYKMRNTYSHVGTWLTMQTFYSLPYSRAMLVFSKNPFKEASLLDDVKIDGLEALYEAYFNELEGAFKTFVQIKKEIKDLKDKVKLGHILQTHRIVETQTDELYLFLDMLLWSCTCSKQRN